MILIADRLAETKTILPHFLVLELMGIERQLAALTREVGGSMIVGWSPIPALEQIHRRARRLTICWRRA